MEIVRSITLKRLIPVFEKMGSGPLLRKTNYGLDVGDIVGIGKREKISYDHQDQWAYPIYQKDTEQEFYLLEDHIQDSLVTIQ